MSRSQIILLSVLGFIALLIICGTGVAILFLFYPRNSAPAAPRPTLAPTIPTSVPTELIFEGEGSKIEFFTVTGRGPTFFGAAHTTERETQLLTVEVKRATGASVGYVFWENGSGKFEASENLEPGEYMLEIDGVEWVVIVSAP